VNLTIVSARWHPSVWNRRGHRGPMGAYCEDGRPFRTAHPGSNLGSGAYPITDFVLALRSYVGSPAWPTVMARLTAE